ncbi:MAG: LPS export ABC transporter permease LptG [Calditrichaceae bacterium]|nr:LPS export ABC transporter permease LptG [Calditrichaceae bacterium]MBN2710045.1 LPS export ABC transporter permease LptG [Calditrichaceae bacterium]RQV92144.1 MAG: LPS export ABC transporter permease LptG [Calditrichota bacterium]
MKILDIYILKRFLINLAVAVVTWLVIFMVVDIIENLSKFLDRNATMQQVGMYYLYYIPHIFSLTLPVSMLLSSLFTMSQLAQHNEVVAQLSSGISLYRILLPLFILGVLFSTGAGYFNEIVVPYTNQQRYDLKRYEIDRITRPSEQARSNIYRQDKDEQKINIRMFNGKTNTGKNISIKYFDGPVLVKRVDARDIIWEEDHWRLRQGKVRTFKDGAEMIHLFEDSAFYQSRITPGDLIEIRKKPEEMSYWELSKFIQDLEAIGADNRRWIVERHLKIALPFANFIVVLLGAPLASRKRRGGMGLNFGLSFLASFVYFFILRVGQVMGQQGSLDPVLAAWLGNLIFIVIGLYTLLSVRK